MIDVADAETSVRESSLDFTRFVATAATAPSPPASMVITPAQAAPPSTTVDPLAGTSEATGSTADPGFISSTRDFGLFSTTSAADPDDNKYVAFVLESLLFTFVLTSATDPEDNLGFGAASIGVAGFTVGTFITPLGNFSFAIPIEDPFADLYIELVRRGF